ncbi:glycosyltransferase [Brackiella oedipodis]|uniref:glycosyltransferase n=1 Tax=Brackiella oedipodis TaxID=124225 RepID=UPI000684F71F|nr:glycosyltransferase [Brackiella oedipodis]
MSMSLQTITAQQQRINPLLDCSGDDLWRFKNFFYGPIQSPLDEGAILIIGKKSELEIRMLRKQKPDSRIIVCDDLEPKFQEGIEYIAKIDDLKQLSNLERISYCRISEQYFSEELLQSLLESGIAIDYACGAYESILLSSYQIYRYLVKLATRFCFKNLKTFKALSKTEAAVRPFVSVVVPAYGVEKYLDQCLETLAHQTLEEIEVIVVDDGAKDRSGEIADQWAAKYPQKIKVIHKPNGGCASARNAGLEAATGIYIGTVDGDDWVSIYMFEDLFNAAIPNMVDIAQCGFIQAFETGDRNPIYDHHSPDTREPYELNHINDYIFNQPTVWRRIHHRSFVDQYKLRFNESLKRFDDLPFNFFSLSLANSVMVIPDCHYYYRLGRPGQDVAFSDDRLFIHFDIFNYMFDVLTKQYSNLNIPELEKVEANAHNWALSFIDAQFKEEYRRKANASMKKYNRFLSGSSPTQF